MIFDLGRYWNVWHIFWPGYAQINSVMFEVAVCITLYIVVMWIEFSPVFLEKLGLKDVKRKLNKLLFFFIALGVLLPIHAPVVARLAADGVRLPGPPAVADHAPAAAVPDDRDPARLRGGDLRGQPGVGRVQAPGRDAILARLSRIMYSDAGGLYGGAGR